MLLFITKCFFTHPKFNKMKCSLISKVNKFFTAPNSNPDHAVSPESAASSMGFSWAETSWVEMWGCLPRLF